MTLKSRELKLFAAAGETGDLVAQRLLDAGAESAHLHRIGHSDDAPLDCEALLLVCDEPLGADEARALLEQFSEPVVTVYTPAYEAIAQRLLAEGAQDALPLAEATPGALRRAIVNAIDRSLLKHELRRQNARLQSVIDANVDGAIVIDPAGKILFLNPAAERLLGRPANRLIGHDFGYPVVTGEHAEIELRSPEAKGVVTAEMRCNDVVFEERVCRLLSLRDISERKEAERQALRYRKRIEGLTRELTHAEERERRRLARVLHDDLQQALVAARMTITLADQGVQDFDTHSELLSAGGYVDEATRICRLLVSELTPTILDDLGLVPALEKLCRLHRERFNVQVRLRAEAAIHVEDEDLRSFLFQSVRELLFNAAKHAQGADVSVELISTGGNLQIVCVDNGPGFDPDAVDKQDGDTGGFGLFQIRQRAEHFGGQVRVLSRIGKGTRFKIVVPYTASSDQRGPAVTVAPADGDAPVRVVLIEDSRSVRHLFTRLLAREEGVEVVGAAATGEDGFRLVCELEPDAVLADVSLPDTNGVELVQRLVAERPATRVIGLSMHDPADIADAMIAAGASGYLCKNQPIEDVVEALLGAKPTR